MRVMDPALREGYETSRRMQLRHDPTYYFATRRLPAELRPATHALYGYVRTADQIVDGPRRPPTPEDRRAALDAWEAELERGSGVAPADRPRAGRRRRAPPAPARRAAHLHALDADRLRARCGSPAGRSSWPTWTARPARSGGSWPRCWACRRATTPTSAGSGSRSSSRTSSATSREDTRLDRIYLPQEDRARFGVSEDDLRAREDHARRSARCSPTRSSAPARLFAAARPAIASAPASVRPGVRFAIGLYGRMLDRVEATGFDVLGRKMGVRVWHIPGAALEALR